MKYVRLLHLLLAFLLTAAVSLPSVGCDRAPASPDASDTDAPTGSPAEPATKAPTETTAEESVPSDTAQPETEPETDSEPQVDLTLIFDNATDYSVVYPEDASAYAVGIVNQLRDTLVQRFRLSSDALPTRTDRSAEETAEGSEKEILVGMTNRQETQAVAATLEPDSYAVAVVGSKLVIVGTDEYRTAEAVARFIEDYATTRASELILPADTRLSEVIPYRGLALAKNATLRIMSWNLQCPAADDYALFTAMQNGINYYGADIIGLQECNKAAHQGVVERVADRYAVATTYHAGTSTYDYTPILYNPARFDLIESGVEWLDGRYTGTNTKCLSWAVFSDRENGGAKLIVVNFHGAVASSKYAGMENMTSEELTAQATAWKIDNIHQLHRRIAALEETYGSDVPVFVTGDYNTSFGAEPYQVMESYGYLDAEYNAATSAMTGTKSTHTMGQKPVAGKSIDHLFYSPDRGVTVYVHAFGLRQSDLDATDHLPLLADLTVAP